MDTSKITQYKHHAVEVWILGMSESAIFPSETTQKFLVELGSPQATLLGGAVPLIRAYNTIVPIKNHSSNTY